MLLVVAGVVVAGYERLRPRKIPPPVDSASPEIMGTEGETPS
jgi:hypothetical protein